MTLPLKTSTTVATPVEFVDSLPQCSALALRKLDILNAARELFELRSPPGNRLEALRGNWQGYYSIRVNDQWRIVFRWLDGDVDEVQITDYH